jgi:hypothetical protein
MGVKKSLGYAVGIVSVIDVLVVIAVFAGPNKHGVSKAAVPKIKVNNRTVQCAWKVRCYINYPMLETNSCEQLGFSSILIKLSRPLVMGAVPLVPVGARTPSS